MDGWEGKGKGKGAGRVVLMGAGLAWVGLDWTELD